MMIMMKNKLGMMKVWRKVSSFNAIFTGSVLHLQPATGEPILAQSEQDEAVSHMIYSSIIFEKVSGIRVNRVNRKLGFRLYLTA